MRIARTTDAMDVSGLSGTENYMVTRIYSSFRLEEVLESYSKGGHEVVEVEDLGYIAIY